MRFSVREWLETSRPGLFKLIVVTGILSVLLWGVCDLVVWHPLFQEEMNHRQHQEEQKIQNNSLRRAVAALKKQQPVWETWQHRLGKEVIRLSVASPEKVMSWINTEAGEREIQIDHLDWMTDSTGKEKQSLYGIDIDVTGHYEAIQALLLSMIQHVPPVQFSTVNWRRSEQAAEDIHMTAKGWFFQPCGEKHCE